MLKDIQVAIRQKSPLLMHRYIGEQPSDEKPPKGKKTQEWIDQSRRKKWLSGAYFDQGTFHVPPENLEALLAAGATAIRKGRDFKAAVAVVEDFIPLTVYSGPDDTKGKQLRGKLDDFYVPDHIDIRGVKIGQSRVDACRPIFRWWGLEFTIRFDSEYGVRESDVQTALKRSCLGDFRPRFGRFNVVRFQPVKGEVEI
jgi:hypothetical protein